TGYTRPAIKQIGFSSTLAKSKNPRTRRERRGQNRIDRQSRLLLLLFFLGSLFLRSRGGSHGLALFLLLGDNFRSGGSSFGHSDDGLFFYNRGEDRKCGQVEWHFGRNS